MSHTSQILLVLQRQSGSDDFSVKIQLDEEGYKVYVNEQDERDPYRMNRVFDSYEALSNYVDALINQALDDRDVNNPFTHFQYNIPLFPSVIVPLEDLREEGVVYTNFVSSFDVFFS
jgi:hypothetical protein